MDAFPDPSASQVMGLSPRETFSLGCKDGDAKMKKKLMKFKTIFININWCSLLMTGLEEKFNT